MGRPKFEYMLHVWNEKPEDLLDPPGRYWQAHITGAHVIPKIGEAIESPCSLKGYNRFRVFDVRHGVGGGLGDLVTIGISEIKEIKTPSGNKGFTYVLAYAEPIKK